MNNPVMKPAWAGTTLRLDPSRFPQQVSYAIHDCSDDVNITIDERGAVLRKVLPSSGLPLSIALPKRVFKGVAARAIDHDASQREWIAAFRCGFLPPVRARQTRRRVYRC